MIKTRFVKSTDSCFNDIKNIRISVFINEQGANANEEFDNYDVSTETDFAVVVYDDKIVGTGRIVNINGEFKIGRIVILKEYRNKHLGKLLVESLIEKAQEYQAKQLFVDAQIHAVPFYEKFGFKACSNDIIDRGMVHRPMVKIMEN